MSAEPLLGAALAQALAPMLVERGAGDQAYALQLPAWPSRAPGTTYAVAVTRGQEAHLLAHVDLWSLATAPPATLGPAHARVWRWQDSAAPQLRDIADALVALARAWWAQPDAAGVLDVCGRVTGALMRAQPAARWCNLASVEPGPWPRPTVRCLIGVEDKLRWPHLVDVIATSDGVRAYVAAGAVEVVDSLAQLTLALPRIVAGVSARLASLHQAATRAEALAALAARLTAALGEGWRVFVPLELEQARRLSIGREREGDWIGVAVLEDRDAGGVALVINRELAPTFADGDALLAALPTLMAPLLRELDAVRAGRLRRGERFRVLLPFGGAARGDVLVFAEIAEVRPSGVDHWLFHREGDGRSVVLAADDAEDDRILTNLADHLARA